MESLADAIIVTQSNELSSPRAIAGASVLAASVLLEKGLENNSWIWFRRSKAGDERVIAELCHHNGDGIASAVDTTEHFHFAGSIIQLAKELLK